MFSGPITQRSLMCGGRRQDASAKIQCVVYLRLSTNPLHGSNDRQT